MVRRSKTRKRGLQAAALVLVLGLSAILRLGLLPFPLALWNGESVPVTGHLLPDRVARTEHYRGFWRFGQTFGPTRSRAILAVLQDSSHFGGDTTPYFTELLVYYDAEGRILGYTNLDLGNDLAVAATDPGGFYCGAVLTAEGRRRLLRALSSAAARAD